MLLELLIIFIIISILMFILSIMLVNDYENLDLGILAVIVGILFAVLASYGFFQVDIFYSGFNVTSGNMEAYLYTASGYNEPYPIIFLFIVFIFIALFIKIAFNFLKKSVEGAEITSYQKRR